MVSDPISDMLTRIRNGYMAKRSVVEVPHSGLKEAILKVLKDSGYIESFEVSKDGHVTDINIVLKYNGKEPALSQIRRVSRPSVRIYTRKNKLPKVLGGMGDALISTPKGIMTDKQARKLNLGGEVICEVW